MVIFSELSDSTCLLCPFERVKAATVFEKVYSPGLSGTRVYLKTSSAVSPAFRENVFSSVASFWRCMFETIESLSTILFMSQSPLFLTVTDTGTFSPICRSFIKFFETIRSHFFSIFMILYPVCSYFLPLISSQVVFTLML